MAYRLRIEEKADHDIWGSLVDLEVADESEELGILEILERHLQRPARVFHDEKELPEPALRAKALREKGVKSKKRGEKKRRRR